MPQGSEEWGLESVDPSQSSSGDSSFRRVVRKVNSNATCRRTLWVIAFVCAFNVIFMLIGYDVVVEKVAVGQMVLQNGTGRKYEAWTQAPMPVYYKVTVFNLTNPYSFMKGDRPRLKECGPYTYRMLEKKINVTFHDNDTVTYRTQPMYLFEPELSQGGEDDVVWTVNIPLINAADAVKSSAFYKTVIQVAQKLHGFKTLRQLSVRELLWGYQSHVMDWARTLQSIPYPHPQFGLLVGFNNTPQEPYTMYTGASDPSVMNTIYSWNGMTKLHFWSGDYCNEIKGTDASGFHPGVKDTDKLYIFNGQLCRSLPLVYKETVVHSGVETFRFVPPADTFSYGNGQNDCFCSAKGCPRDGLLDMKPCYYGAAVAFSFPHFYQSDPRLKHDVRGLNPDPEIHGTQFDIYPALGVPVRVKLRMQMNVVIDGNQALQRARHFDVVFPVFWFEAGIDSLPVEMVGMLKMAQDVPPMVKATTVTLCTTLSVLFLVLLFASTLAAWCGVSPDSSRTHTPDHLPEVHWPSTPYPIISTSGYAAGSLASLEPNDSFRTNLPPYRQHYYHAEEVDGYPTATYDAPPSEDQPPAYTAAPDLTKTSSSSLLSVEIHKSASLHDLDADASDAKDSDDEVAPKELSDEDGGGGAAESPRESPTAPPLGNPELGDTSDPGPCDEAVSSSQESPTAVTDCPSPSEGGSHSSSPLRPPPLESAL